jgi:hypothetical protein
MPFCNISDRLPFHSAFFQVHFWQIILQPDARKLHSRTDKSEVNYKFYIPILGATHTESSAGQSARTTEAPTPIGTRPVSDNV